MRALTALPALMFLATPAFAQEHAEHGAHDTQAEGDKLPKEQSQAPAMDHSGMDHGSMDHGSMDHGSMDHGSMDHGSMDHGTMDHGSMDHGSMDHGSMDHGTMDHGSMDHGSMDHGTGDGSSNMEDIPELPPPPEAFEGPKHAADAFVGADAMAASRKQVVAEVSGTPIIWIMGDRYEYRAREGDDGYLWDLQGFYGSDIDKFWFKSEGEGSFGEKPESAEVQALWSHAIDPWWDLQLGMRQDLAESGRTHAVIGVQGLTPYLFEVDAAAFLSTKGELTARIEAELDQRITQRLILQPRVELGFSAQDMPALATGSGLTKAELGIRLRYEIAREFAPYIGIEQEWLVGKTGDYARAAGSDPSTTHYVAGIRFWF